MNGYKNEQTYMNGYKSSTKQKTEPVKIIEVSSDDIPCLIYLQSSKYGHLEQFIKSIQEQVKIVFQKQIEFAQRYEINMIPIDQIHLSLSNVFRLALVQRSKFINLARNKLHKAIKQYLPIGICFQKLQILKDRYIVLKIDRVADKKIMDIILPKIDQFLSNRGFKTFKQSLNIQKNDQIILHITVAKLSSKNIQNILNTKMQLRKQIQQIKVPKKCFAMSKAVLKMGNQPHIVAQK